MIWNETSNGKFNAKSTWPATLTRNLQMLDG